MGLAPLTGQAQCQLALNLVNLLLFLIEEATVEILFYTTNIEEEANTQDANKPHYDSNP
jgi:hypothetical protein